MTDRLPEAKPEKLVTVVRLDLPDGAHTPQAMHAYREFLDQYPATEAKHYEGSNHLAVVTVPDYEAFAKLLERAIDAGIDYAVFREPDFGDYETAATFAPGPATRWLTRDLPLLRLVPAR